MMWKLQQPSEMEHVIYCITVCEFNAKWLLQIQKRRVEDNTIFTFFCSSKFAFIRE